MKLDQNLYRTPEGQWRIRFVSEEMKIAARRGQPNVFDLPFPPTLVSTLETYLTTWRPVSTRSAETSEVFLNQYGRPFNRGTLYTNIRGHIYRFTGKRWHPHMIRTVWATEWIKSSGDFMTAAIMLNDRLETVIQNYSHLREENVAENAYEWVQKRINSH
jgi:site-specific recombinase XerD